MSFSCWKLFSKTIIYLYYLLDRSKQSEITVFDMKIVLQKRVKLLHSMVLIRSATLIQLCHLVPDFLDLTSIAHLWNVTSLSAACDDDPQSELDFFEPAKSYVSQVSDSLLSDHLLLAAAHSERTLDFPLQPPFFKISEMCLEVILMIAYCNLAP